MSCAKYVGRVGALAVTFGIGSVIGGPHIAWADDVDASNVSTTSATSTPDGGTLGADPPGTTSAPTAASSTDAVTPATDAVTPSVDPLTASGSSSSPVASLAPGAQSSTSVSVGDSPTVTINAQTNGSKAPAEEPAAAHPVVATPEEPIEPADHDNHVTSLDRTTEHPVLQHLSATTVKTDVDSTPESRVAAFSTPAPVATTFAAAAVVVPPHLPTVSVAVTNVDPAPTAAPLQPIRNLVLGVLGVFGFSPNPAPGQTNNPILEALWGAYRRIESFVGNETPTVGTARVVATSFTPEGKVAVTLRLDAADPDADPLTYRTTDGTHGTLSANGDGTYTYLADADFTVFTSTAWLVCSVPDTPGRRPSRSPSLKHQTPHPRSPRRYPIRPPPRTSPSTTRCRPPRSPTPRATHSPTPRRRCPPGCLSTAPPVPSPGRRPTPTSAPSP